jgi:hypothetical protein
VYSPILAKSSFFFHRKKFQLVFFSSDRSMVLSLEDRVLLKALRVEKHWGAKQCIKEFPNRQWNVSTVHRFLQKVDETGNFTRKKGSGRPRSIRNPQFIPPVAQRPLSDPNNSQQFIDSVIDEFHLRIRACINAGGGHFEHLF